MTLITSTELLKFSHCITQLVGMAHGTPPLLQNGQNPLENEQPLYESREMQFELSALPRSNIFIVKLNHYLNYLLMTNLM
jgi:hypothetical protein